MSQREAVCAPNDEIFHPISIPVCSYYYSSAMLNSSSSRLFHPPLPAAAATATATATQQPTHPISHLSHPQLVPHVIPRCPLTPTHSITTSISSILDPTPDSSAYFRINPEEEDCTAGETYKVVVTNRSLVKNGSADVSGGRAPREKRKSGIAGSRTRRMMGPGRIVVPGG